MKKPLVLLSIQRHCSGAPSGEYCTNGLDLTVGEPGCQDKSRHQWFVDAWASVAARLGWRSYGYGGPPGNHGEVTDRIDHQGNQIAIIVPSIKVYCPTCAAAMKLI